MQALMLARTIGVVFEYDAVAAGQMDTAVGTSHHVFDGLRACRFVLARGERARICANDEIDRSEHQDDEK
jgi:hypothetical protein